jgi:hypothetical protein
MAETTQAHFTSWTDLYYQLLEDLANPSFRKMQSYSVQTGGGSGSRNIAYRSLAELKAIIDWVKSEMVEEQLGPYKVRTLVRNMGRG